MKACFSIAVLAISFNAFASGGSNNNGPQYGDVNSTQTQGQAQGQTQLQGQGQAQNQALNVGVNNRVDNDVRSNANAYVTSLNANSSNSVSSSNSSSGSSSNSNSASSSGGNSQTINVSGDHRYSGAYSVKNVPNAVAPAAFPTSPCMGGTSVGASGVGFGVSFGSSWTDDECGIRETARSFAGMGMQEDAVSVLCTSKYASAAQACKK